MPHVLGVDYGTSRIGIALWTGTGQPAALQTLAAGDAPEAALAALQRHHNADVIVVGLPRSLDGNETAQTKLARAFADQIQAEVPASVILRDEAATSSVARERLEHRFGKQPIPKGLIDQESAVIILEDYIKEIGHE